MEIDRRRRKTCVVCERELPKYSRRGRKRKRMITCSPKCSKTFVRMKVYAISPYLRKIKKLEEELKKK